MAGSGQVTHTHTHFGGWFGSWGWMVPGRGGVALVAVMLSSLVLGSTAGVVSAAESVDTLVTETGEALDVAGGLVADAAPLSEAADGFVAQVAGNDVEIPVDAADPLVLDGAGGEVAVELPAVPGVGDGVVDESGAVVFESDVSPVSLAAQATVDGALQVLVVIDDATAPTEYRFEMTVPSGAILRETAEGGAEVVGHDGAVVSVVAPPWAVDASGAPIPTSYRVEASALVQVVNHEGASYPVVADPKITFGWGIYVYMTGSEVYSWATAITAAGGIAGLVGCEFAKLPVVIGRAVRVLCITIGGPSVLSILRNINKIGDSIDVRACYEFKGGSYKTVDRRHCSPWW